MTSRKIASELGGPVRPRISIVVPVYAGRETLEALIRRCAAIRSQQECAHRILIDELIFVCDDPVDDSELYLVGQAATLEWVKVISLARNSGQHVATAVGMIYSSGDWIMTIDEDLQHPPELLREALLEILERGLDIMYIRSTRPTHGSSKYRDFTSKASKACMRLITKDDYSIISSFRIIRGELARAIAPSIDKFSYLDSILLSTTSSRKRGVLHAEFHDSRNKQASGYSLKKLFRHYVRLIMSAEYSGLRLVTTLASIGGGAFLILIVSLVIAGFLKNVQQVTPGWLSLFGLACTMNILLVAYISYSLKILSILLTRSGNGPRYLVICRDLDPLHRAYLALQAKSDGRRISNDC